MRFLWNLINLGWNTFQATFEGWMEVMKDAVDSTEVCILQKSTFGLKKLFVCNISFGYDYKIIIIILY